MEKDWFMDNPTTLKKLQYSTAGYKLSFHDIHVTHQKYNRKIIHTKQVITMKIPTIVKQNMFMYHDIC